MISIIILKTEFIVTLFITLLYDLCINVNEWQCGSKKKKKHTYM